MRKQKTNKNITESGSKIRQFRVTTAFGTLIAAETGNPDFPGIYICIEQTDEDGDTYEQDIVLVEDTPTDDSRTLRVATWEDMNSESYTRVSTLSEKGKDDA